MPNPLETCAIKEKANKDTPKTKYNKYGQMGSSVSRARGSCTDASEARGLNQTCGLLLHVVPPLSPCLLSSLYAGRSNKSNEKEQHQKKGNNNKKQ